MENAAVYSAVIALSYLYGAIPWGLALGKTLRHIDVRQFGSGNIGFTNVLRTLGLRLAIVVLALDASKGVLPVLLTRLVSDDTSLQVTGAVAGIIGHTWPVYLRFRGGKGVATAVGAVAAMAPIPLLAVCAIGLPFLVLSRYVSLTVLIFAPVLTALMLALLLLDYTNAAYFLFVASATIIILYRHRDNIRRLRAGTESKIGWRAGKTAR